MLKYAAKSDVGCRRSNNEDSFSAVPELNLWVLADGVGGHDAGEVASDIACRVIRESVAQGVGLEDAIHKAHDAILAAPANGQGRPGMASTVVALQVEKDGFHVSWVGDSRCYLWSRERGLEQISRDHSLVQRLLEEQHITEEEAGSHPGRNVVLQALGQESIPRLEVESIRDRFEEGQILLLCSDGLNDYVAHADIVAAFERSNDVQEIADQLISKTLANDGADNVTVVLVAMPGAASNGVEPLPDAAQKGWLRNPLAWLIAAALVASAALFLL
ncbi:PP2C family serine/threonine-protein phosphatase [Litorivivens sp.]|uniref:PP2C family protein-serine/threonine phosphatase n=1 Tax=Litorivivens sp. TaxID=2020868 RepID=UPI0035688373